MKKFPQCLSKLFLVSLCDWSPGGVVGVCPQQKSGVTIMVRAKNIRIGHMYILELIIGKGIKGNTELTFKISPGCQRNGGVRDPLGLFPLKCQQVHQL